MTAPFRAHRVCLDGALTATTALAGALVMVIEVLGARLIGPYYGVSLFVWTALISVTLAALALGYAVGGALADRHPTRDALYALLLAAGLLILPIPALAPLALPLAQVLGLRGGALATSCLLFGPSLFVLGCVTPWVARVALEEVAGAGRVIGRLYAASTAGSIVGTLFTGFVLVPALGVVVTLYVAAVVLITTGAGYFLLRRRHPAVAAAILPLALAYPSAPPMARAVMPDGTRVEVIARQDSGYGEIKVVDYRHGELHTRELLIDGLVQGGMDVASGFSIYEYATVLERMARGLQPDARRALAIGLGAGLVPARLQAAGIATVAVDIDPVVHGYALRHFGLSADVTVHIADARAFIARDAAVYDLVLLDVYTGDITPAHLLTREALLQMKARLAPDGVWLANLIGEPARRDGGLAAVVATLQSVFETVVLQPLFEVGRTASGNVIVAAYDGPVRTPRRLPDEGMHESVRTPVQRIMATAPQAQPRSALQPLSDDDGRLELAELAVREQVRRTILDTTPGAVLAAARVRAAR